MVTNKDVMEVYDECLKVLNFNLELGEEYSYNSLSLCILDSVFLANGSYSAAKNVVDRYCDHFNIRKVRVGDGLPSIESQEGINEFLAKTDAIEVEVLARDILKNRQVSMPGSEMLKIEVCLLFAQFLQIDGVNYFQDLHKLNRSEEFFKTAKLSFGSDAILERFFMLAGDVNMVKIDRVVRDFVDNCVSKPVKNKFTRNEYKEILMKVSNMLSKVNPSINPRKLNYCICYYMNNKSKNK